MKILFLLIIAASKALAADYGHEVKAIKFLPNSQFAFKLVETMCDCKGSKCTVSDESGDNPCVPEVLSIIELKSDKAVVATAALSKSLSAVKTHLEPKVFPLQYNGDTFTTALDEDCNREDESNSLVVDEPKPKNTKKPAEICNIYLVSKKNGRKKIASLQRGFSPRHEITATTYYLSPDEPRLAVIVTQSETQFEESSTTWQYVHGADLSKGFKK